MLEAKYIDTLGFKVFSDNLDLIDVKNAYPKVINTISPNSYGLATRDADFFQTLKRSDYLVLDGVYFAFASILLQGKNIKKNQGPDVFDHFIKNFALSMKEFQLEDDKSRALKINYLVHYILKNFFVLFCIKFM